MSDLKNNFTRPKSIWGLLIFVVKLFYKQARWIMFGILVFGVLSYLLPRGETYVVGKVIDYSLELISSGDQIFSFSFVPLLLILAGVMLLSKVIDEINSYLHQLFQNLVPLYQDRIILGKYIRLDPQLLENPAFLKIKNKLDWNFYKTHGSMFRFVDVITSVITVVIYVGIFINYDWRIVLVIIGSLIPGTWQQLKFGRRIWGIWGESGEDKIKYSIYKSMLGTDELEQYQEVKVLGYGQYLLDKAVAINQRFIERLVNNEKRRLFVSLGFAVFEYGFVGLGYFLIFQMLFTGRITVGEFYFVGSVFNGLRNSTRYAFNQLVNIQADRDILQSFYDVLHVEDIVKSGEQKLAENLPVSIEFKNVWFKYPKTDKWIFRGLNLQLSADEDIALVGKNGAGKTTMIKLLLRIYDPDRGQIKVNGVDLKEIDLESYYRLVGVLSQNFNTLGITAAENIYLGNTKAPFNAEMIKEAAEQARADEFIMQYPKKYKTFLSKQLEGGTQPSGGQMQRIAIARIFFRKPRLMILDEPTSAIDSIAEQQIFENIQQHAAGRTVIIVSHRFSTVKKAKRIVVLDKGKIIEQGSHPQLLKSKGLYSEMYHKQVG